MVITGIGVHYTLSVQREMVITGIGVHYTLSVQGEMVTRIREYMLDVYVWKVALGSESANMITGRRKSGS